MNKPDSSNGRWNISAWAIKNPIPSIVLFLVLTLAGFQAFTSLGIDENPNIDVPTVLVSIAEPGAAPSELETQVTRPVEDAVAGIGNIKHITSTVSEGLSSTSIEFELGTNTDRAVNDVRDAITRIRSQIPQNITEPVIQRLDFTGGPFVTYTVSSNRKTIGELSWLIDNTIARDLLSVRGVGQVQRTGGVDREVQVNLDPTQLESIGITADSVSAQVRNLNINLPGGRGQIGAQEQTIRTLGSAQTIDQLANSRIALPANGWATLRQLGTITDSAAEPTQAALLDGKPVVAFSVVRSVGSNLVQVARDVNARLERIKKSLPADVHVNLVRTNEKYVADSYHATIDSLLLGAALAVLVIYLALRDWRSALISALAMPLSMIPTFAVMKALGFTLNNMSLLALALVIGILVDDAIVEVENIVRHMHMGKSPYKAAMEAADEIGLAVVATTMSIIVVFAPVAFMGGIPGQFFKQFGITVAVAVFFSLLVARLITPMMAAHWLKVPAQEHLTDILIKKYNHLLRWALDHRGQTVTFAVIFCLASFALMSQLPTALVSSADRGETLLSVEMPPGTPISATQATTLRLTNILLKHNEVEHVFVSIGTPATGGGRAATTAVGVQRASMYIILKPRDQRQISQQQFEDLVRPELKQIPGARLSFSASMGLGGRVQILLAGTDTNQLELGATRLTNEMRSLPGLFDVTSTAAILSPQILVVPDSALASQQGVSIFSIARTAMIGTIGDAQMNLAKFDLPERQIDIRVQLDPKYRKDFSTISNLKVLNNQNKLIPLNSVASVEMGSGPATISRYDRRRQVTVTATLQHGYTLGDALKDIHKLPAFTNLPTGVEPLPTGDVEIQRDVFNGFGGAIASAILFIYAVLVLLFNDFLHPLTIMVSLPLSIGGAAIGLMVSHQPLGLYALIGIVMLMGLVTKNAILLVEYCLMIMHQGQSREAAVLSAGEARMRPILMTTVAMIVGMLPIALGLGAGSEVRSPMAVAVVGGLVTSTFLTLILVPVVFTYFDDFKNWLLHRRSPDNHQNFHLPDPLEE